MKKIPTIYKRDPKNPKLVTDERNPECDWVFNGEGRPTRKWDGTAVLIQNGQMYKRRDLRKGMQKPDDFIPADEPDSVTGHWPGWTPVSQTDPGDKWHREACNGIFENGTYELLYPRYQGRDSSHINPENVSRPILVKHGIPELNFSKEPTHDNLKMFFTLHQIEGIAWYHEDGRMAKIKARDFGMTR